MEAAATRELPRVLVVDDDPGVLKAVYRLLSKLDVLIDVAPGPIEALSILRKREVAVVVSDMMMPGMSGLELLTLVRQNWPAVRCVMMTACGDIRVAADAVNQSLIHYFINKPWENRFFREVVQKALNRYHQNQCADPDAEDTSSFLRNRIQEASGKAAFSLARAVDARDRYTHQHSERVAAFAQTVGRAMGLSAESIDELRVGGLLHDVGKIGVPDEVLLKPGKLTAEEFASIRRHPEIGSSIVEPIEFPWSIATIVRQHHENHDGSGYPAGLGGPEIILPARIIHVVDAYEAMAANRVYRTAREAHWIVEEFKRCRGTQFDPEVTDVFLDELKQGRMSFRPADQD